MNFQKILYQFDFKQQCRDYGIKLWQNPNFLFLVMGGLIILTIISTYFIAGFYVNEPEVVALIVIAVTLLLLILSQLIVINFDSLAKLNKLKSDFISVASHQLRAPLASLKWTLSLFLDNQEQIEKDKDKTFEYLGLIKNSTDRMIKLINDLLDVSRIDANIQKLIVLQKISITETIEDVIQSLAPLAKASNVSIELQAEQNLPQIKADPLRLASAIQNIVDNGIKYIKGKGNIWIKIKKLGKFIKISVKDTGVGIPTDQRKYIFQKFFRSDNVMRHEVMGSGLGLFIAKAAIEAHDGKISFESKNGEGTTFYILLPIKT